MTNKFKNNHHTLRFVLAIPLLILTIAVSSCGSTSRESLIEDQETEAQLQETYGAMRAKLFSDATTSQVVELKESGLKPKLNISIPPKSLSNDSYLLISESVAFDTELLRNRHGIEADLQLLGIPVLLELESGADLESEIFVELHAEEDAQNLLASQPGRYVVLYRIRDEAGAMVEGLWDSSHLSVVNNTVKFPVSHLGVFQVAAVVSRNEKGDVSEINRSISSRTEDLLIPKLAQGAPLQLLERPVAAIPGQTLSIRGQNFFRVSAFLRGNPINSQVESSNELSLQLPSDISPGLASLTLRQDGVSSSTWILITEEKLTSVVFATDPKNVCTDQVYLDLSQSDLIVANGERNCEVPDCESSGQSGCLTTEAVSSILSSELEQLSRDCDVDGDKDCYISGSDFKAAKVSNIDASQIKAGTTVAGVSGTLNDCSNDGQTNCIANATFSSADLTNLAAGNIRSGITIGGITGNYPSPTSPMVGASVTNDLTSLSASIDAGTYEFWDSQGTRYTGTVTDAGNITPGTSDQEFTTSLYKGFSIDGSDFLQAGNIRAGVTIFNINGTFNTTPDDCEDNGTVGCVTTTVYKSADLTNLSVENIKNGVSLAGVVGGFPSSTYPLVGASGDNDLTSMDASLSAGDYEFWDSQGTRYTGTVTDAGTITPGTADQNFSTSLYKSFTVSGSADLVPANIKTGVTIFTVDGTIVPAPSDCNTNGTVGCVTTATFQSADLTNLSAATVKSGVTIAGVSGDFPSSSYPLTGATADDDLTSMDASINAGDYEFWDSSGARYTGTVTDAGTITPGTTDQGFSATLYKSFVVSGSAALSAANIKTGATIFGVDGNVTPAPSECDDNGTVGCVTTDTYQAADLSNLTEGNIKSGESIAGVDGDYPSSTYPLSGNSETADLDLATFDAKIKSATEFEWFDASGTAYTRAGDNDISAENLVADVTIFGTTGSLEYCTTDGEVGCKTTETHTSVAVAALNAWDIRKGKSAGGISGELVYCQNGSKNSLWDYSSGSGSAGLDIFDTIDDLANGESIPEEIVSGNGYICDQSYWSEASLTIGGEPTNCTQSNDDCMLLDNQTELIWGKHLGITLLWETAISTCASSTLGGYTDWQLPTQKQLMQASINGIRTNAMDHWVTSSEMSDFYWSATTNSTSSLSAWSTKLATGETKSGLKLLLSGARSIICVR